MGRDIKNFENPCAKVFHRKFHRNVAGSRQKTIPRFDFYITKQIRFLYFV